MLRPPGRSVALASMLLLAQACGEPAELTVDLRTDWKPFVEFDAIETRLSRVPFGEADESQIRRIRSEVRPGDDFLVGTRVAELDHVELGRSFIRVALLDARGGLVADRTVDLVLQESFALTVVITRNCRDLFCPGPGDAEELTACLDGRCVDPRCTSSTPEHCGEPSCTVDSDCATGLGCTAARCIDAVCLCDSLEMTADAGPRDAGPPRDGGSCTGGCTPGETETETETCGECGEGMRTRTRTCGDDCTWGAFGAWSECATDAECSPGQTDSESRSCRGACGGTEVRRRSCDASTCRWGRWGSFGGCPSICCGDGACNGDETCTSCTDCQAGHLGTGSNGDSCAGVPAEQWRCVTIPSFGTRGSQVCRDGRWVTFHLNPRDCEACVCAYSTACRAPGA